MTWQTSAFSSSNVSFLSLTGDDAGDGGDARLHDPTLVGASGKDDGSEDDELLLPGGPIGIDCLLPSLGELGVHLLMPDTTGVPSIAGMLQDMSGGLDGVLPFFHQAPVLRAGVLLDGEDCAGSFLVAWLLYFDSRIFLLGEAKMSGMLSTDVMVFLLLIVAVETLTPSLKTSNFLTNDFTVFSSVLFCTLPIKIPVSLAFFLVFRLS